MALSLNAPRENLTRETRRERLHAILQVNDVDVRKVHPVKFCCSQSQPSALKTLVRECSLLANISALPQTNNGDRFCSSGNSLTILSRNTLFSQVRIILSRIEVCGCVRLGHQLCLRLDSSRQNSAVGDQVHPWRCVLMQIRLGTVSIRTERPLIDSKPTCRLRRVREGGRALRRTR